MNTVIYNLKIEKQRACIRQKLQAHFNKKVESEEKS